MNKFVLSAIALTTAGGLASAGTGSEEWLSLDREIASLASAQATAPAPTSAITVGGFIRSSYLNSGDILVPVGIDEEGDPIGNDLGGFFLDNARLEVNGTVGDYSLFISLEAGDLKPNSGSSVGLEGDEVLSVGGAIGSWVVGSNPYSRYLGGLNAGAFQSDDPEDPALGFVAVDDNVLSDVALVDAYGAWNFTEQFALAVGQFRAPFLASSMIDEDKMLFLNRSWNSDIWDFRDLGAKLSGNYDMLSWALAVQNGADGAGDDLAWAAHVAFNAMGSGNAVEGAYGAANGTNLAVSAGYYMDDDSVVEDLTAWNVGANLVMGPLSLGGEIVSYDQGFNWGFEDEFTGDYIALFDEPMSWDVTASFMFVPDKWEVAARYQDLDDEASSTIIDVALNYYGMGHGAKWQADWTSFSSDLGDADILGIGLTVSI